MALFTKESLENLRQRVNLVDVLESHLELKRAGGAYKALCPFHDEKSPSFMVQAGDTHYHCFGCGAHGDAIQFLTAHLQMSFSEAIEHLAEKFHVVLERVEKSQGPQGPSTAKMREALEAAAMAYHAWLLHAEEGEEALRYLYKRGMNLDFIREFQIGLAPKQPLFLKRLFEDRAISQEILEASGLVTQSEKGRVRDFFSDRIMFPIRNSGGSVIAFSARKFKESTFGGKYINTVETPLFKKSKTLFGMDLSRRRIAKERRAVIVEGQIDALRLIHEGLNLTVASLGTAFGEGGVRELLLLGVNTVFLAFDSDLAGQEAARKVGALFQKKGVEVFVLALPAGDDPDSIVRKEGIEKFLDRLEHSNDYLTFLVEFFKKQLDIRSPAAKQQLVQTISEEIRSWENPIMVHESLKKLARLVEVSESLIGIEQISFSSIYVKRSSVAGPAEVDPDKVREGDVLRWLLLPGPEKKELLALAEANLKEESFRLKSSKKLFQTLLGRLREEKPLEMLDVALDLQEEESQEFLSSLMYKKVPLEKSIPLFKEALQALLDRNWMLERDAIRQKIQTGECSEEEVLQLAKSFDALKGTPPKVKT